MRLLGVLRQRSRPLFRGAQVNEELAGELALHLEQLIFSVHARRGEMESVGQENFRDWQAANPVFQAWPSPSSPRPP